MHSSFLPKTCISFGAELSVILVLNVTGLPINPVLYGENTLDVNTKFVSSIND